MNLIQSLSLNGHTFSDKDVVNPDDFIPAGESNYHNVRPFLLTSGTDTLVVFADCLQDALDEAVDQNRLDAYQLTMETAEEYEAAGRTVAYLGNASEPFDIELFSVEELESPPFSFCAMFNAANVREG